MIYPSCAGAAINITFRKRQSRTASAAVRIIPGVIHFVHKLIHRLPVEISVHKVDFFVRNQDEFHYGNITCCMRGNLLQYI